MLAKALLFKVGVAFITLLGVGNSQFNQRTQSIVINGHAGEALVYDIDGKSFIDLAALVRIANGSAERRDGEVVVTIPAGTQNAASASEGTPHELSLRLSAEFISAAIKDLATIREWTEVMAYAVQRGTPGDGTRLRLFQQRAEEGLRLATVSARSDVDQSALILLTNQFNAVSAWTDKLIGERRNMDTGKYSMTENALSRDETYQKITSCTKFLSNMLPGGELHDDYSCH